VRLVNKPGCDAFKTYATDIEYLYDVTRKGNLLHIVVYSTSERDGDWTITRIFSGRHSTASSICNRVGTTHSGAPGSRRLSEKREVTMSPDNPTTDFAPAIDWSGKCHLRTFGCEVGADVSLSYNARQRGSLPQLATYPARADLLR
jgi:hypothetical protein